MPQSPSERVKKRREEVSSCAGYLFSLFALFANHNWIGRLSLPDKHVNIGVGVKHRVIRQKKMNPAAGLHNVQTRHQTFAELLLTDINRLSHTIGERPHCNLLNLLENIVRVSVLEAMRAQKQQM